MIKHILTMVLCLAASLPAGATGARMSEREFAETRLMAEWAGAPEKQFVLGDMYYNGEGVPQDYAEAAKWFEKAADQGHVESQYMLGQMIDRGHAAAQDHAAAVAWYRKAAEKGHVPAQFALGGKYAEGRGIPQNFAEAYVWFNLAAASGMEAAVEARDLVAKKLSNQEISEAQRRSTQLFEQFQKGKPKS